jgi:DNA polymerase
VNEQALQALYAKIAEEAARDFGKTADDMVFGEGLFAAPIMLVGEAPGAEETRQKKPFVGKAGENLNEFLQALDLKRDEIFITNVVKFRPYVEGKNGRRRNRPPTRQEQAHQALFLMEEIAIIRPSVIVTLGNVALGCLCDEKKAVIGALHGQARKQGMPPLEYYLFPLYHPASIIYNRALKTVYESDLLALKAFVFQNLK